LFSGFVQTLEIERRPGFVSHGALSFAWSIFINAIDRQLICSRWGNPDRRSRLAIRPSKLDIESPTEQIETAQADTTNAGFSKGIAE